MPLVRKPSSPTEPALDDHRFSEMLLGGALEDRWTAARNAPAVPNALPLLSEALSKERAPRVREAILTALARIGSPESAAVTLPYLRSDDAAQRTAVLDALRAMPAAAATHLPSLLSDADADVRLLACEIACGLPTEDASRLLGDMMDRELNPNVCAAAIEVLAETGDATSLPVLARCSDRFPDDPFLKFAINVARDRIGSR